MTELTEFKGKYSGRIFLIGHGPSWKLIPHALRHRLNNEFTFVGSRFFQWPDPGFSPKFYILTERRQSSEWLSNGNYRHASADIARFWVTWQPAPKGWVPVPRPPSNAHDVLHYGLNGLMGQCFDGTDGQPHIHHGKDTPLAMLQVAMYMGFTEFYLIGCDTTQEGDVFSPDTPRMMHAPGIMQPYYARAAGGASIKDCTPGGTLAKERGGPLEYVPLEEVLHGQ